MGVVTDICVCVNRYQVMPILTPAYPSMNSSFNVSTHTLAVMKDELKRALGIVQDILNKGGADWSPLFDPSDFFAVHQHYLAVDVYTESEDEEQAWCGFCESRIRKLVESLAYIPQLCRIRTFTKKYPLSFVETQASHPSNGVNAAQDAAAKPTKFGVCFFVGFDIDRRQLRGREVSIDNSVDYFKHNDLYRWNKRTPTMDVKITPVVWKNLPECVFEDMGGRQMVRNVRREFMKKKKEEEKAAEDAANGVVAGTSSGEDTATAAKDTQSQDTDGGGTCEEDNASATEDSNPATADNESESATKAVNGKESASPPPLPPGSPGPNPAAEGSASSSPVKVPQQSEKSDLSTPVKPPKTSENVGASPQIALPGKRERDGSSSAADTPIAKKTLSAPSTPSMTSTPSKPLPPAPAPVPAQQRTTVPAPPAPPAAISSPRKRRKMKITFAKLN